MLHLFSVEEKLKYGCNQQKPLQLQFPVDSPG